MFATTADPSLQGRYILTQSYSISHRYLLYGLMKSDLLVKLCLLRIHRSNSQKMPNISVKICIVDTLL
jgi:hypothetical protein